MTIETCQRLLEQFKKNAENPNLTASVRQKAKANAQAMEEHIKARGGSVIASKDISKKEIKE